MSAYHSPWLSPRSVDDSSQKECNTSGDTVALIACARMRESEEEKRAANGDSQRLELNNGTWVLTTATFIGAGESSNSSI